MSKRVSPQVVRNVVRDGSPPPREAGARRPRTPSYLVRRRGVHYFQVRPPKGLVACQGVLPPMRVRLGVLPRRDAQRRALTLGALAHDVFDAWRRHMEVQT